MGSHNWLEIRINNELTSEWVCSKDGRELITIRVTRKESPRLIWLKSCWLWITVTVVILGRSLTGYFTSIAIIVLFTKRVHYFNKIVLALEVGFEIKWLSFVVFRFLTICTSKKDSKCLGTVDKLENYSVFERVSILNPTS